MALMALDHASLFVGHTHSTGEFWAGALPVYPDSLAFLTRAVTHLCAPGFFLLMGASMVLFAEARRRAGWSEVAIARHFAVRGALLILLQLTVENAAWALGPGSRAHPPGGGGELVLLYFGVLYALGGAMIAGALLLMVPRAGPALWGAVAAGALLATHLLLPAPSSGPVLYAWALRLLLVPGRTGLMQVYYPLIPWLAPLGAGLVLGHLLARDDRRTYRLALLAGAAALALFVALRAGVPAASLRPAESAHWTSFLALTKYPPAATFLLSTLGVDLLLLGGLAALASAPGRLERVAAPLLVFGRSALFFYLAHLYLYALLGLPFRPAGTGVARMYPVWILGLALLYPLCLLWARFKESRPPSSLWRLL